MRLLPMGSSPDGLISARCGVITKTPGWEVLTTTSNVNVTQGHGGGGGTLVTPEGSRWRQAYKCQSSRNPVPALPLPPPPPQQQRGHSRAGIGAVAFSGAERPTARPAVRQTHASVCTPLTDGPARSLVVLRTPIPVVPWCAGVRAVPLFQVGTIKNLKLRVESWLFSIAFGLSVQATYSQLSKVRMRCWNAAPRTVSCVAGAFLLAFRAHCATRMRWPHVCRPANGTPSAEQQRGTQYPRMNPFFLRVMMRPPGLRHRLQLAPRALACAATAEGLNMMPLPRSLYGSPPPPPSGPVQASGHIQLPQVAGLGPDMIRRVQVPQGNGCPRWRAIFVMPISCC